MKLKILSLLLVGTLVWAVSVTVLYSRLKNNPKVVAVTTDLAKESFQNLQLSDMEKVSFLRQYLERYFNFDSNNFWQSQTSVAFLMTPNLRDKHLAEVNRTKERIQQKNLSHLSQLKSLKLMPDGSYLAETHLQIREESQENKKELYLTTKLKLQNTERSLENPWGLLVSEMTMEKSVSPFQVSPEIFIKPHTPTLVMFPCAVENMETSKDDNLKYKITTFNVSEVQFSVSKNVTSDIPLKVICKDIEFTLTIKANEKQSDLFKALPKEIAIARKKEVAPVIKKGKRDRYQESMEKDFGIEFE